MRRGQVWWGDLGEARGSAPAGRRPLVIVSDDTFNQSRIATVTVVPVTTNLRWAKAPGNVFLPRGAGGLREDSVANVTQVATVDRVDLGEQLGKLEAGLVQQLDAGLRRALGL
jgi:mRNA interferase MazF